MWLKFIIYYVPDTRLNPLNLLVNLIPATTLSNMYNYGLCLCWKNWDLEMLSKIPKDA